MLTLHEYFRSSSSFRTRIALNLKGLEYRHVSVHLRRGGGEHLTDEYARLNPQRLVPTLVDDGHAIAQSLAIIEYLEETHPEPPLLPKDPVERAEVRAFAQLIACEMHPLNNLRTLQYLRQQLGQDEAAVMGWIHHWLAQGFASLEATLSQRKQGGGFCFGDRPGLAEVCLVPQVNSGERFKFDFAPYPNLRRIHDHCMSLEAFRKAAPANQPDAE